MAFESDALKPIDLERAVKTQHGAKAVLVSTGSHLYDWKAKVGTTLKDINLKAAVRDQYGRSWRLSAVGVHKFDWKAVRPADLRYLVLPVVIVASDQFFRISRVRRALKRFQSVLVNVRNWYDGRVNKTVRLVQPLIVPSNLTSAEWNNISDSTANPPQRFELLKRCIQAYEDMLPTPGQRRRVVLSVYTGDSKDVWLGAAAEGGYAVVPPRATSLDCPASGPLDARCADAAYAVGHELGHTFGLGHTCSSSPNVPNCAQSIMETGKPPGAILLKEEICHLIDSPFFYCLAVRVSAAWKAKRCVIGHDGPVAVRFRERSG